MMPSERRFAVLLNTDRVGTLHSRQDYTWFDFTPEYLAKTDRAVLGLQFEEDLKARHRANMRLPPWFSNLLPEGRLREWVAEARGVSADREMELLAQLGLDLPGAVQVTTDEQTEIPHDARREVLARPSQTDGKDLWRFSLAGVGLKFSMLAKGDRFTAPAFGDGGDWIVKLPDPTFVGVPQNEFLMMTLAARVGLDVPSIRLVHRDELDLPDGVWFSTEEYAYAIQRFDRTANRCRVHIEDFAQVRGLYPQDKYTGTFETLAALIFRRHDLISLREFARRLAFNVLIGNGDAHLKNWSLIYTNPRIPRLSPAYDLVCTAIYRPPHLPEDLGLRFGGSRRLDTVSVASFRGLQAKVSATGIDLEDEIRELATSVRTAWAELSEVTLAQGGLVASIGSVIDERLKRLLRE